MDLAPPFGGNQLGGEGGGVYRLCQRHANFAKWAALFPHLPVASLRDVDVLSLVVLLNSLYINSSSSRAGSFLWTRYFLSMVTRAWVASKCVWRRAQNAGLTHNNFGDAPFCVDNPPLVPKLSTGLPTSTAKASPTALQKQKTRCPWLDTGFRNNAGVVSWHSPCG